MITQNPNNRFSYIVLPLLLLLLIESGRTNAQIDSSRKGYGKAKVGIFFKRYFDFKNSGNTAYYQNADKNKTRLAFPFDTEGYSLAFSDEFDSLNTSIWQIGQPWGRIHLQHTHQYYSDSNVQINNGCLHLLNTYSPKLFRVADTFVASTYAVGLINTYYSFSAKYGYFAIRSKNPKGLASWPAFWLTGKYGWPPEIDILEMYGRCKNSSINEQTASLHFGSIEAGTKGSLTKSVKLQKTNDEYHIYSCLWEPDQIKFYTDGVLVIQIKLNDWLQKNFNAEMYIVLNNAIDNRYADCAIKSDEVQDFSVDWIRVYTK